MRCQVGAPLFFQKLRMKACGLEQESFPIPHFKFREPINCWAGHHPTGVAKKCPFIRGRPSPPDSTHLSSCKTKAGSKLIMPFVGSDSLCKEDTPFVLLPVGDEKGTQLVAVSQDKGKH